MQKASRYIYILLKNTFIITVISLLLAWAGGEGSFFEWLFGLIGIYGVILAANLLLVHVLFLILAYIFKKDSPGT